MQGTSLTRSSWVLDSQRAITGGQICGTPRHFPVLICLVLNSLPPEFGRRNGCLRTWQISLNESSEHLRITAMHALSPTRDMKMVDVKERREQSG